MIEVDQELQAKPDYLMGLGAFDVGDKANAAGVVLVVWVVKTLFRRQTHTNPSDRFRHAPPAPQRKAKEMHVS